MQFANQRSPWLSDNLKTDPCALLSQSPLDCQDQIQTVREKNLQRGLSTGAEVLGTVVWKEGLLMDPRSRHGPHVRTPCPELFSAGSQAGRCQVFIICAEVIY